jgi:hypothetical protein
MATRIVDALSHPNQRNKVDGRRTDDTTTRWLVQKRTYFKGNYDRVLTVADSSIGTQMPNLQVTNAYTLSPDFSVKSLSFEKDCLILNARPSGKVLWFILKSRALFCLHRCFQACKQDTAPIAADSEVSVLMTSQM